MRLPMWLTRLVQIPAAGSYVKLRRIVETPSGQQTETEYTLAEKLGPTLQEKLRGWVLAKAYRVVDNAAYTASGVLSDADIEWPDLTPGHLATTHFDATDNTLVNGFEITYLHQGEGEEFWQVTQEPVTRDVDGNVTEQPRLLVTLEEPYTPN